MRDESNSFQSTGEGASPALSSLSDLRDFTVADGDPDVRGWDVFTGEGRRIGEVHDLLVDTAAMKVRYLDVHLDRELLSAVKRPTAGDRHVLIPIGRARLDRQADRILVDSLRTEDILDLPDYDHGPISREHEAALLQRFDRGYVHAPERDFYSHSLYDDESFYSNRRRQSGTGHTENGRREEAALNSSRGIL